MAHFTELEIEALRILNISVCSISLCGSLFMIVLYLFAKELRIYAFKLVFLLSLGDFIKDLTIVLANSLRETPALMCSIEGFLMDSSQLSVCTWCLSISSTLYQIFIQQKEGIEIYFKRWLFIALIVMPILQIPPFITESYGLQGTICTLKEDFYGNLWRLLFVYLPIWTHIFLTAYFYAKLYLGLRTPNFNCNEMKNLLLKTIKYPIILLITMVPISTMRLIQVVYPQFNYFALEIIAWLLFDLQGIMNAIAYGWTDTVQDYILWIICKRREKNRSSYIILRSLPT
jgi:hypothetical protein